VCGGGFLATGNTFTNNTSVIKSSNGGAISLVCDFVTAVKNVPTSDLILDQAQNKKSAFPDQMDFEIYEVFDFYAEISDNTFEGNEIGQKGSAIYTRQLSLTRFKNNKFIANQPGYSYRKDIKRPYEVFFLQAGRSTLWWKFLPSSKE